jgi:hypothetical protein
MEVHIFVTLQPAVVFGFVSVQVVENDMNLPAGVAGDDFIHEVEELPPSASLVMAGPHKASGDFQCREQCRRSMPLVAMTSIPRETTARPMAAPTRW